MSLPRSSTADLSGRNSSRAALDPKKHDELLEIASIDHIFQEMLADKATFFHNTQTALRGAAAITLVVGAATVPGLTQALPPAYQNPLLLAMIGFWFVLTFGKTVGFAVRNAWQAISGTLIAVLNSLVMNAVFPGGAKLAAVNGYKPAIAWIDLAVVVFLVMYLNISNRCRTFSLFYLAMFMMHFMNPHSHATFSRSWTVDINGTGVSYLVVCLVGTSLAVLFTFIPWPRTATREVELEIKHIKLGVSTLMSQVVASYNGTAQSSTVRSKLARGFRAITEKLAEIQGRLDLMWWEGFDLGDRGKLRHLSAAFVVLLRELTDIVRALQLAAQSDVTQSDDLMDTLNPQIADLVQFAVEILEDCGSMVADGDISTDEQERMKNRVRELMATMKRLTAAYTDKRSEAGLDPLDLDLLEEDFFMYNLAQMTQALARYTANYDPSPGDAVTRLQDAMLDIVDPDLSRNHWNFVLRGYCAYMTAFVWGVYLGNYNFLVAATVALVMSQFLGSAIERNLGRMQGVVLGVILPAIVLHQLPSCSGGMGTMLFLLIVFVFEAMAIYIYQSASSRFSYIAMLTAAFAAQSFFQPCEELSNDAATSHTAYAKVTATVSGIIIVLAFDSALANERPSQAARIYINRVMSRIRNGLEACLESKIGPPAQGVVKKELRAAEASHLEAAHEPRFWRAAYPEDMVEDILVLLEQLRLNMRCLEQTARKSGHPGETSFIEGDVEPVFAKVQGSEEFQYARHKLLSQYDQVVGLLLSSLEHEGEGQVKAVSNYEHDSSAIDVVLGLAQTLTNIRYNRDEKMVDDPRSRTAVAIFMFANIHYRLDDIVEVVLSK